MMLILTYHKVVENAAAIGSFFDVSRDELDRHVGLAKKRWQRCLASSGSIEDVVGTDTGKPRGFLFTFDDGTEDHYTEAAPILERHGVRGVFFVNPANFGMPGFLTVSQCTDLQTRGHKIESHSLNHDNMTYVSADEASYNLAESRRILKTLGASTWDLMAPPGGQYNHRTVEFALAAGYKAVRTLEWGYNTANRGSLLESFTINRSNVGLRFNLVVSPFMESAKKRMYVLKEKSKKCFSSLYYSYRDSRHKSGL